MSETRWRRGLGTALVVLATGVGSSPREARAQVDEMDAGRMELRVGGERVAVENFRVWRQGESFNAAAVLTVERGPGAGTKQVVLKMTADRQPLEYIQRHDADGPDIDFVWRGDRWWLRTSDADGERTKEFANRLPATVVLEPGVAHHYLVLVARLPDYRPEVGVSVIHPSDGRQTSARLSGRSDEPVEALGRSYDAVRYDVQIMGDRHSVWVGPEGRLLRVLAGEFEAVRVADDG